MNAVVGLTNILLDMKVTPEKQHQYLVILQESANTLLMLINDMLDFVPRKSTSGKPAGSDLKDGKVTLPLVYALEQANALERDLVADVLRDRSYDTVSFENVLALVDRYNGIERTRARALQFTDRARQIVAEFPDSLWQRALYTLTDLVMECNC